MLFCYGVMVMLIFVGCINFQGKTEYSTDVLKIVQQY